jgi:hypothetical protein
MYEGIRMASGQGVGAKLPHQGFAGSSLTLVPFDVTLIHLGKIVRWSTPGSLQTGPSRTERCR